MLHGAFPEWLGEAQQVAIRVLHEELSQARARTAADIVPGIGEVSEWLVSCRFETIAHPGRVLHLDLQVHAAAPRSLKVGRAPGFRMVLLDHELRPAKVEVSERRSCPLEADGEAQ